MPPCISADSILLYHQRDLRRHSIHSIDNIIVFFEGKFIGIFRQEEALVHLHLCVGIDLQYALPHRVRLVLAHGSARRNDLPVQVGQAHPVVVDQVKRAHAAAR